MGKLTYRTIDPLDKVKLTQAGFSRQLVSAWVCGVCYPSIPKLRVASKALGMTTDQFLTTLENTRRMKDVMDKVLSRRNRDRERHRMSKAAKDTVLPSPEPR